MDRKTQYYYFAEMHAGMFYEKREAKCILPSLHLVRGFSSVIEPTKKPYVGKTYITNVLLRSPNKPDIVIGNPLLLFNPS